MNNKLTSRQLNAFARHLRESEKSAATVDKYLRDVRAFYAFTAGREIDKQAVLDYKAHLGAHYAATSANSMLAALNTYLRFCERTELCVKRFKVQREVFCAQQKELSRGEYFKLLEAARTGKNQRLCLILQTICGTGIRVSELPYITVESLHTGQPAVRCKGKNRRIFLVPALRKKLIRYAKEQGICNGSIFVTKSGKPITRHTVWRQMKGLCKAAG
ncbi:MAG: tyrosine-type recombinase/integrase, partial [Clostridia bacterium]|nr:tyrosine-type recombinase/integrase [Clostridia bacterium]